MATPAAPPPASTCRSSANPMTSPRSPPPWPRCSGGDRRGAFLPHLSSRKPRSGCPGPMNSWNRRLSAAAPRPN